MKTLMQVTSPREITVNSISYAYQISYHKPPTYNYHKILVIHKVNRKIFPDLKEYSLNARYYHVYFDGHIERRDSSFSLYGYYNSWSEALAKVFDLIVNEKRGTGTKRQWERFYKTRVK